MDIFSLLNKGDIPKAIDTEFESICDEKEYNKNALETRYIMSSNIENREKLSISGVLDVLSFDDQIVIVETELGLLTIKGENLKINKLSIDTEEVIVEGDIVNLGYSEKDIDKKAGGFLGKIFK